MKFTAIGLALAGTAAAAPAPIGITGVCPVVPSSFQITDFHFGGQRGPIYTESYSFNISGLPGAPEPVTCIASSAGGSDKCDLAFRDIEPTQCGDSGFEFSFLGNDVNGFTLQVNYTLGCGQPTVGCRFFPASEINCVSDSTYPNVMYEDLTAPESFTMNAELGNKCVFN